jgi:hypothetical protein
MNDCPEKLWSEGVAHPITSLKGFGSRSIKNPLGGLSQKVW